MNTSCVCSLFINKHSFLYSSPAPHSKNDETLNNQTLNQDGICTVCTHRKTGRAISISRLGPNHQDLIPGPAYCGVKYTYIVFLIYFLKQQYLQAIVTSSASQGQQNKTHIWSKIHEESLIGTRLLAWCPKVTHHTSSNIWSRLKQSILESDKILPLLLLADINLYCCLRKNSRALIHVYRRRN